MGYHEWKSCIDACLECAAICNHCASSCTREEDVKMMARCIDLDMQCASVCYAAAQLMSLGSPQAKELCSICARICDACGTECGQHNTKHCEECAEPVCVVQSSAERWQHDTYKLTDHEKTKYIGT
jgi:hypothetical protein